VAQLVQESDRQRPRQAGQQDQVLVAALAVGVAVKGDVRFHRAHEARQHGPVHRRLAAAAVEAVLEVVDVQEGDRHRGAAQGALAAVVAQVAQEQRRRLEDVELLVVLALGQAQLLAQPRLQRLQVEEVAQPGHRARLRLAEAAPRRQDIQRPDDLVQPLQNFQVRGLLTQALQPGGLVQSVGEGHALDEGHPAVVHPAGARVVVSFAGQGPDQLLEPPIQLGE
jgi:hypothetical protein